MLWKISKIDSSIIVTDQKKIINLRHIIVHEYDLMDDATILRISKNYLPILKEEINKLLQ